MYCRKCGHALEEGDAFCTNCGTPVPADELVSRRMNTAAHNPEFNWNVREEFPEPRKRETMVFNWADGSMKPAAETPSEAPAEPTAPVEPSFRDTLESRPAEEPAAPAEPTYVAPPEPDGSLFDAPDDPNATRVFATRFDLPEEPFRGPSEPTIAYTPYEPAEPTVHPVVSPAHPTAPYAADPATARNPYAADPATTRTPYAADPATARTPAASDTTERELFRDIERADEEATRRRDDRFYTFTRKNEEFQRLLDREYERVRRNGTPVERPMRTEPPLFGYEPETRRDTMPAAAYEHTTPSFTSEPTAPVTPSVTPTPVSPARPAAPAYPAGDTIGFSPAKNEPTAPVTPTPVQPTPVSPTTAPPQPTPVAPVAPAPAPAKARPEPTYRTDPDEIRTIWEEIKADMERENAERIAKAAEAERVAKMNVEAARTDNAGRRVGVVSRKDLLTPSETEAHRNAAGDRTTPDRETPRTAHSASEGHSSRDTGEVAAVTATALTRIWENDEDEKEEPKKKGRFWLWFFLIILLILLGILAVFVIQTFWPDTAAANVCADIEVWLKDVWAGVKELFDKLFKK